VTEFILAYWEQYAFTYYVNDGRPTSEQHNIGEALRPGFRRPRRMGEDLSAAAISQRPARCYGVDDEGESGSGPVRRFESSTTGRVRDAMPSRLFTIGDIHGSSIALARRIEAIDPQAEDTVVVLGDFIDCGRTRRTSSTS
jgi:hypothetical protein